MSPSTIEGREAKRTRQACVNCRRKKTRCSGEHPFCSNCVRLRQRCGYNDFARRPSEKALDPAFELDQQASAQRGQDKDLATRVALLESRLGMTADGTSAPITTSVSSDREADASSRWRNGDDISASSSSPANPQPNSNFTVVPPLAVLRSAADVYFASCQNQPYCYFHETQFRKRLEAGTLPSFLLLSFMATAARYSHDDFFKGLQFQAIDSYAQIAWLDILNQAFSSDPGKGMDIFMVQATNMLAVIDFTAGRHRLGWVKIGLSVRFAQGLKLNSEPDSALPIWQQEEHRRVFWSVYLLDKLVSCSRNHPPTILDVDCTLRLPASEDSFRAEIHEEVPTLEVLHKLPDVTPCLKLDDFALTVLAASFLGRVLRYTLQQGSHLRYPPWDSRSDYAKMISMLLSFECLLTTNGDEYLSVLESRFTTTAGIDRQRAGHFIWSRGLYQLCNCFLTHPLLMRRSLNRYRNTYPRTYIREASRRCQDCVGQLSAILRAVTDTRCCARGSFLGYLAVAAGTVHQVYTHSKDEFERVIAAESRNTCLEFLESQPLQWEHYPRMAKALRTFDIDPLLAQEFIDPSLKIVDTEVLDHEKFRHLLDYGWLCDASRNDTPLTASSFPMASTTNWGFLEDLTGDDGFFTGFHDFQGSTGLLSARAFNGRGVWFGDSRTASPANPRLGPRS